MCSVSAASDELHEFMLAAALKNALKYYEVIHADNVEHRLVKRGIKHSTHKYNTIKEVEFKALGKNFRLILHPHREVLHSNFRAYAVDGNGNETIVHMGKILYRKLEGIVWQCCTFCRS